MANEMTDNEIVDGLHKIEAEYLASVEKLGTVHVEQKSGILRDLSTAGLAVIGGALTFATVGERLLKTPVIFYIGAAIVLFSVIVAIYYRIRISRWYAGTVNRLYSDFATRSSAVRNILTDPNLEEAKGKLAKTYELVPYNNGQIPKSYEIPEVLVSLTLLIGTLLCTSGIIFTIQ